MQKKGLPQEAVMHAVSNDLIHWEKIPQDTFYAPAQTYEPHDWRDPFVFWNDERNEYNMLLTARIDDAPHNRKGCTALCVDEGYRGTFIAFVKTKYKDKVDVSEKIKPKQWEILPKRWCVERTFAWENNSRRLSKDYEILTSTEENMFMISHLHMLLKRL